MKQQDTALVIFRYARQKQVMYLQDYNNKTNPKCGYLSFIFISYVVTNFADQQHKFLLSTETFSKKKIQVFQQKFDTKPHIAKYIRCFI
jgi:hypothetical protein